MKNDEHVDNNLNKAPEQGIDEARRRIEELEREVAELRKANDSKAEFISHLSHDIRTPIAAIQNLTQFARADINDRASLMADLDRIETSNSFLLSLVSDVLDISEIDYGEMKIRPVRTTYQQHLKEIRNILLPMCEKKGIHCRIIAQPKAQGLDLYADTTRLKQIAMNLISNAVRYTPPGGTITYRSEGRANKDGTSTFGYTLTDTGIGMTEDFQSRIFQKFETDTENPFRSKMDIGSGLGLYISNKIASLMGGKITVRSRLGDGTSFTVRIPMRSLPDDGEPAEGGEQKGTGESPERHGKFKGRVLLAEDNEINAEIAMRVLGEMGLKVIHADNGQKATDEFRASSENEFSAVFMDIQMPIMNGYDATKMIRGMGKTRKDAETIPIIAMTADVFTSTMSKAKEAGMNAFLTKPLEMSAIENVLKNYIPME